MEDHGDLRDAVKEGEIIWREYARILAATIASSASSPAVVPSSSPTTCAAEILPRVLVDIVISYVSMAVLPWPSSMSSLICYHLHGSTYMVVPSVAIPYIGRTHKPASTSATSWYLATLARFDYDRDFPVLAPSSPTI